jgi:dihydroneopterin aldolase
LGSKLFLEWWLKKGIFMQDKLSLFLDFIREQDPKATIDYATLQIMVEGMFENQTFLTYEALAERYKSLTEVRH